MKKTACFLIVFVVLAFTWVSSAAAIMTGFEPSAQSVTFGESVDVDIIISGLEDGIDEIVSAYSIVIGYDETVLSVANVSFGLYLNAILQFITIHFL